MAQFSFTYPPITSYLSSESETKHTLRIEPLLPGFGYTLGNSLRRVMLSSIPGAALTRVKINEITHEYQAITGVVEDAFEVILNLKEICFELNTDENSVVLTLSKTGASEITAADFEKNAQVKIINPDAYICTLDKTGSIEIEIEVSRGVGYLTNEEARLKPSDSPFYIFTDALFSPVRNVALNVEQVRVGDKTNFDRAEITFETDGTVSGKEAAEYAMNMMITFSQNILSSFEAGSAVVPTAVRSVDSEFATVSATDDEIDLPKRIKNILEKNGVTTNTDLKAKISEVAEFGGISEKSLEIIKDYLKTIS